MFFCILKCCFNWGKYIQSILSSNAWVPIFYDVRLVQSNPKELGSSKKALSGNVFIISLSPGYISMGKITLNFL